MYKSKQKYVENMQKIALNMHKYVEICRNKLEKEVYMYKICINTVKYINKNK